MLNILILNWGSTGAVRDCISALIESDFDSFRIILINNYSTHDDLCEIRDIFHFFRNKVEIRLIENPKNLGYAGGNNAGIRYLLTNNLAGDILILNPDVRVSVNTLSEMSKALDIETGIVTVRTINSEGEILYDAIKLRGFFQKRIITDQICISTDYSQGSCMLIKREIVSLAGLFDERFFLYWEEVDFSLRVKSFNRRLVAITTTSVVKNDNPYCNQPYVFYYSIRNARLIKEKHPGYFSTSGYILYAAWMAALSLKFILKPAVFMRVISFFFKGLADSSQNRYFEKPQERV